MLAQHNDTFIGYQAFADGFEFILIYFDSSHLSKQLTSSGRRLSELCGYLPFEILLKREKKSVCGKLCGLEGGVVEI